MPKKGKHPSRQGAQQDISAAQNAAMQAAASMGLGNQVDAPMDFSQGIPVGPAVPPQQQTAPPQQQVPQAPPPPQQGQQIQQPGSLPPPGASSIPIPPDLIQHIQQAEAQAQQQYPNGVPQEMPPGYQQPQQTYPTGVQVPPQPPRPRQDHPLLVDLKRDLGISREHYFDFDVGGHIWKMRALTAGDAAMGSRVADAMSGSPSEYNVRLNVAMACLAVAAIDDTPIFEVFGVEVPTTIVVNDPLMPPPEIRLQGFFHLYDWVMNDTKGGLGNRLWDIYSEELDQKSFVSSYMDNRGKDIVTFRCPTENCKYELMLAPEYENGSLKPVFCQHHGTPMVPQESVNPERDGGNVPLP